MSLSQIHRSQQAMAAITPTANVDPDNHLSQSDEETILPRHMQIELSNNRKRIMDLEDQLKELRRMSIRKIFIWEDLVEREVLSFP